MDPLLTVEGLRVSYRDRERSVRAVDGVDVTLYPGRTLALVGESGCGKTSAALAILGLVPSPGEVDGGRVVFEGRDLYALKPDELRSVRGAQISMIFQDPASGLNPVLNIGTQLDEIIRTHTHASKIEARRLTLEALRRQRLPEPERIVKSYPFQLSGGMCQRVMIAIATLMRPKLIIADEPTSALDVTVQAGILRELDDLKRHLGISILLITHDFGVVAGMADDVAVMYAGRIVERATSEELFASPRHPYSAALLGARPRIDRPDEPLVMIRGTTPDAGAPTDECAFLPRCPKATSQCRAEPWPALEELAPQHAAACFNPMFQAEEAARA